MREFGGLEMFHRIFILQRFVAEPRASSILISPPFGVCLSSGRSYSSTCSSSSESRGAYPNSQQNKGIKWYSSVLSGCASNEHLSFGKEVHGRIIRSEIEPDLHMWVSLVNFYARCGCFTSAYQVFDEMPEKDVVAWTCLIFCSNAKGYGTDALKLYCRMRKDGISPDKYTSTSALKACSSSLDLKFGMQLHSEVIKLGLFAHMFIGSALVDLYAKCGEIQLAERLLFCLPEKDAVTWNILLSAYASAGDENKAFDLFSRIRESNARYSKYTLSTLLKVCADTVNPNLGRVFHCMAIRAGCELDEYPSCCLLDMYSMCGLVVDALTLFKRIRCPSIIAWSVIINCLDKEGQSEAAAALFNSMRQKGVQPNQHVIANMVGAAAEICHSCYSESIHGCVVKYGYESEIFVNNRLITMYMNLGYSQKSLQVFENMPYHDLVSWNALLTGLNKNESFHYGPRAFMQMLREGFRPNDYTFNGILCACSSLSNLDLGKQIHVHVIKTGFARDKHAGTALINMYAAGNCTEFAEMVFGELSDRDVLAWTGLIAGYAQSEHGEKAVKRFSQML